MTHDEDMIAFRNAVTEHFIEHGTGTHFAAIAAILGWSDRKTRSVMNRIGTVDGVEVRMSHRIRIYSPTRTHLAEMIAGLREQMVNLREALAEQPR